ncbi:MAG: tRNA lysidine(34) synthetase TilS [Bdellovibrionales bacterium]|nr:tRNA lysidine(34) synthetase TilS [Bdellovibrionales bacterium]
MNEKDVLIETLSEKLLEEGRYLIAVSGGLDSMSLLHGLLRLQKGMSLTLEVAHVDHGLREASEDERAFVEECCMEHGIPCHATRLPERPAGENLENWGRQWRYAFFEQVLGERNLDWILTAHHQQDLVETLLMRILSNKEPRALPERNEKLRALRPILGLSREDLEEYSRHHGVQYREDESNRDEGFLRNRVRHSLLPFLRDRFGSSVLENLSSQSRSLEEELSALDVLAEERTASLSGMEFGSKSWLRALRVVLEGVPVAIGCRVVRRLFLPHTQSPLSRYSSRQLRDFLLSSNVAIQLPNALEVRRKDGGIVLKELKAEC